MHKFEETINEQKSQYLALVVILLVYRYICKSLDRIISSTIDLGQEKIWQHFVFFSFSFSLNSVKAECHSFFQSTKFCTVYTVPSPCPGMLCNCHTSVFTNLIVFFVIYVWQSLVSFGTLNQFSSSNFLAKNNLFLLCYLLKYCVCTDLSSQNVSIFEMQAILS